MARMIAMMKQRTYGVSFSVKQCRNFGIDSSTTLKWLINQGFRRFRLMSYWNECELKPGKYTWAELDRQLKIIRKAGGEVTLCLGVRQPRWPENHWPDWAWELDKEQRIDNLLNFVARTVNRYKDSSTIVSYQLENEALLKSFGEKPMIDRRLLRAEYQIVKKLDPDRPIIMTTSTAFGVPFNSPVPDIVGFSVYHWLYDANTKQYKTGKQTSKSIKTRGKIIKLLWNKPCFIHELQLEPWGPRNIWDMDITEQNKSMNPEKIAYNLKLAHDAKLDTIDLWGGEWWYWRTKNFKDPSIIETVKTNLLI